MQHEKNVSSEELNLASTILNWEGNPPGFQTDSKRELMYCSKFNENKAFALVFIMVFDDKNKYFRSHIRIYSSIKRKYNLGAFNDRL